MYEHVHRRIGVPGQEKIEGSTLARSIRHIQFTFAMPASVGTERSPLLENLFTVRYGGAGVILLLQLLSGVTLKHNCTHTQLLPLSVDHGFFTGPIYYLDKLLV